ncbi:MAG: response regulator transcription factor [Candidatus Promineifilaceae bacterium]
MPQILVVDDDVFARNGLRMYLESLGYQVSEAETVQSAWEYVLTAVPHLAVIDVLLPLQSNGCSTPPPTQPHGIELARRLKKSYPTMGIVLLSAHQEFEKDVLQLAQQPLRSIAFLHKGGDMARLQVALEEVQAGRTLFAQESINKFALATAVSTHFTPDERPWIEQAVAEFKFLSPREQEIAHLLSASHSSEHIAERLGLSKGSVDNIISRLYGRLGLTDMKADAPGLRPLPILIKACLLYDIQHRS